MYICIYIYIYIHYIMCYSSSCINENHALNPKFQAIDIIRQTLFIPWLLCLFFCQKLQKPSSSKV